MLLGGSVSPWRSGVEEGRSPLGRFRKPEPCFPRTYATWDAKKDENRFESMKFRLTQRRQESRTQGTGRWRGKDKSSWLTQRVMVPGNRPPCVSAPLRLCVGSQVRIARSNSSRNAAASLFVGLPAPNTN